MEYCDFCEKSFSYLYEYKPTFILWLVCNDYFGKREKKYIDKYYKKESVGK